MSTQSLRSTAFHEAGLAVMAYLQRVPFRQVSVVPDADTLGRVLFGDWSDWANPGPPDFAARASLQRVPFRQVSVVPDADPLGRVLFGDWSDGANQDSCEYRERAASD